MAITDLTNTTWVFNNAFPSTFPKKDEYYTEGDIRGLTPTSDYGYFIDFIWKAEYGEYNCNYIYNYNYDYTTIGVATYPNGTNHSFHGSMTITGGTDATNIDLIAWLQSNATQQATPTTDTKPIFKRINGSWVKQDAFQRVSGQWVKISTKEAGNLLTTSNDEILQDSNGNNLEFKEV